MARAVVPKTTERGSWPGASPSLVSIAQRVCKMGRLMATLPQRVCGRRALLQAAEVVLAVLLSAGSGCARRTYLATELPTEFAAPAKANIEEIDLSRLANYSVNSQLIERGDVLEVTIVTDFSKLSATTTPVRVREDGTADIPLIGKVALAGLELEGAEQAIAAAGKSRGLFRNPHVTVTMKRQRMNRITVIGAVEEAGVYRLPRGSSSLLAALVSAGGLSEDAGTEVEIRRPVARSAVPDLIPQHTPRVAEGVQNQAEPASYQADRPGGTPTPRITRVNLTKAATEGYGGGYLDDGDVVMVTRRAPKPIYVIGLVRKPGEVELPHNQDMHVLDAIAKAGERTIQVADRVIVIRRVAGQQEPIVIELSIREAKTNGAANIRLAPGDIVSVEETPATILVKTVTDVIRIGIGGSVGLF